MEINIRLGKNFTTQYNKLQAEFGTDIARINGFDDGQLSYTDFIDNFIDKDTVADASVDGNSNVGNKDMRTLMNEMPKPHRKLLAYNKIYYEIKSNKLYIYIFNTYIKMKKIQYQVINLKKPSKNIIQKLNIINSISKSNVSTSNFSSINPDKNIYTIESYENIKNLIHNDINIKPFEYNNSSNPLFKSNDNIFSNKNNKNKTFVYIKKNHLYKNKDKKKKDEEIYNKKVLLNDYRKMIMKQFLNYFRPFCLFYLRKYFYCFIRNIS